MTLGTTNKTTIKAAVNLRNRIKREFKEILPLIQLDTEESLVQVTKKLRFLFKLIERFVDDEQENMFKSDKINLEILQAQILAFIKEFEEKTSRERLALAKTLTRIAENALETD